MHEKSIRVEILNKPYNIQQTQKDYEELSNVINSILKSISSEAIRWNAKVQQVFTEAGNFSFVAICDRKNIEQEMQSILDEECYRIAKSNELL